jgi:hypothetical protein
MERNMETLVKILQNEVKTECPVTRSCHTELPTKQGAPVAEWLRSLTSTHLPLTAVPEISRDFGFFHVRKLSS